MKVLHINDKISISGGVEVYLEQLQAFLPDYKVGSDWLGIHWNDRRYQIEEYPSGKLYSVSTLNEVKDFLKTYIASHSIDVINVHSISDPDLIRICFLIKPVVRTAHEPRMFCPGHGKFFRFSEKICNKPFGIHCFYHAYREGCTHRHPLRLIKAYQNTRFEIDEASSGYKKIIVMSDYMAKEAEIAGIPSKKITVNPYFTPKVPNVISPENISGKRILFIGRIISYKGLHMLMQALMPLLEDIPDLCLDVVGSGMEYPQLTRAKSDLKMLGYENRVLFHGWQGREKIESLLRDAYMVVFPSIYPEAFGIVGIEAMMNGKPVVGFDVGGVNTWLKDGKTGYLVETGDVEGMRNRMKELLLDGAIYKKMSDKAREVAVSHFIPEIHIRSLIHTYREAL